MRQFDYYEFTSILVPGTITLFGFIFLLPNVIPLSSIKDFTIGGFGLLVIFSYVLGHLVQAIGNTMESLVWKIMGGIPTDWIRTKPERFFDEEQIAIFRKKIKECFQIRNLKPGEMERSHWYTITRRIYSEVSKAGRATRIDIFNANYGLHRGIAASLLIVEILAAAVSPGNRFLLTLIAIAIFLSTYRMYSFARNYGRELFVEFLDLDIKNSK